MRVFVVGTGRCGTTTFSKACGHIANYTAAHETPMRLDLAYPPRHIEVSPRLTWVLPLLIDRYPDALYVHLRRKKEDVVASWVRRGTHRGPGNWKPLVWDKPPGDFGLVSSLCHDAMIGMIADSLMFAKQQMRFEMETIRDRWRSFWDRIGAEGNYERSLAEWNLRYNASTSNP